MVVSACFLGVKNSMNKPVISRDTIKVPSDLAFLPDVDAFIEETLRDYGVDEPVIADIAISVSELVNNAVLHGNRLSPDKLVTVKIARRDNIVTLTVSDEGTGFNPDDIEDPLADENLLKEIGRGLFIVKSLMDEVDVNPTAQGTSISITKAV